MAELDGAGSTCCAGAGGYSGGAAELNDVVAYNGNAGADCGAQSAACYFHWGGGGYYEGPNATSEDEYKVDMSNNVLGGIGGLSYYVGHDAGDGGTGGSGGTIKVSSNAKIYAYNGNMYTDGTSYEDGLNQAPIYLQNGISMTKYEHIGNKTSSYSSSAASTYNYTQGFILSLISELSTTETVSGYCNSAYDSVSDEYRYITKNDVLSNVDMSKQGIGSGAGYIEVSNGTYNIYSSMN